MKEFLQFPVEASQHAAQIDQMTVLTHWLMALLFILFDVEAVFLYPWAVVYKSLKWLGFIEMFLYIMVLFAGYVYIWKKGALDWNR